MELDMNENEDIMNERFGLAAEKVREIAAEDGQAYFRRVGNFLTRLFELAEDAERKTADFYTDALPENYEKSFLNPTYAVGIYGKDMGQAFATVYRDLLALVPLVKAGDRDWLTLFSELVIELSCDVRYAGADGGGCEEGVPDASADILEDVRSFYLDNAELFTAENVKSSVVTNAHIADIVSKADLSNPAYLKDYGVYIGENEIGLSTFFAKQDEAFIEKAASTFVNGYITGFAVTGKDISKKRTVMIYYPLGSERVVRRAVELFSERGLKAIFRRLPDFSWNRRLFGDSGAYATSVNPQMDFDHKDDMAIYFDKKYAARTLEICEQAFEEVKTEAAVYGGPAVIEVFGNEDFDPVRREESPRYSDRQNAVLADRRISLSLLTNRYIREEERSFTIISFPLPAIGDAFESIMAETMRINTLDDEAYKVMQQAIIDVLDGGEEVHVVGSENNSTDIRVRLHHLSDPAAETNFENCRADVNIPVGECFTSPLLTGTNGRLFVGHVFINGLEYRDLWIDVKDGRAVDYGCANFDDPAERKKLVYENIMNFHENLPIGEFAIGTNTEAYRMGRRFGIEGKLPILIAEKTGPHFAFGDTCYSYAEDIPMMNPDGKECIARSNEVADLRDSDPKKAYFGCHTDITVPFEELAGIYSVRSDGSEVPIIENGLFAVAGCEALNEPLLNP